LKLPVARSWPSGPRQEMASVAAGDCAHIFLVVVFLIVLIDR
jgi:hypothetical protein